MITKCYKYLKFLAKLDLQDLARENWVVFLHRKWWHTRKLTIVEIFISEIEVMDAFNLCHNIHAENCFQLT